MKNSRQVERAEFRAEIKRGARRRREFERSAKRAGSSGSNPEASSLRIAAMGAVSRLSRGSWA